MSTNPFHGRLDARPTGGPLGEGFSGIVTMDPHVYRLLSHQHAYAEALLEVAHADGIQGLMSADTAAPPTGGIPGSAYQSEDFYSTTLGRTNAVRPPWPKAELGMLPGVDAYGVYNWELFFHIPLTVGIHLSKSQRYAEAQRWFHYIFDPTDNSQGPDSRRFWRFLPFRTGEFDRIEKLLAALAGLGGEPALKEKMQRSIEEWLARPFRPHVVAQMRPGAYQWKTLLAYLDNQIAWGDSLFSLDTGEAIDEAATHYVLAANILGERPKKVPNQRVKLPQTYASLRTKLDAFGNALTELETAFVFDSGPEPSAPGGSARLEALVTLGSLYFCVPGNERLQQYWTTVADRLFKIRNSLNIKGVFRRLAQFEPPIDPALLARGVAAGLDVSAVVGGMDMPLPLVRYQLLHQRAVEAAQEARNLGATLLGYMEREDGEALQLLRSKHERQLLSMNEVTRYAQWQEAKKLRESAEVALSSAFEGFAYVAQQLGKTPSEIEQLRPVLETLDPTELQRFNLQLQEPSYSTLPVQLEMAKSLAESEGFAVTRRERDELVSLGVARENTESAAALGLMLKWFGALPIFSANIQPFGSGITLATTPGKVLESVQDILEFTAMIARGEADLSSRMATLERRSADWTQRSNQALEDIMQATKQVRAAQIREAVAAHEWEAAKRQSKQALEIDAFMNADGTIVDGKATGKHLYAWLKSESKTLHARAYDLAFEYAKKAERALQHELGNETISVVSPHSMRGKESLTAADALLASLRELEAKYLEENRREFEMVKHVSLLQVAPLALVALRHKGTCTFSTPEALFDIDAPGQYFRRIKSVGLTMACVIGPYVGLNCELTQTQSWIRRSPDVTVPTGYLRAATGDDRFDAFLSSTTQVVTSGAQADSGLFETNLRDERFLPFEGAGVIGSWNLTLPAATDGVPAQFDYSTISDVILHLRYTARSDSALRKEAAKALEKALADSQPARLLSLRHEFPTQWARLLSSSGGLSTEIVIRAEQLPYWWGSTKDVNVTHVVSPDGMTASVNAVGFSKVADDDAASGGGWIVRTGGEDVRVDLGAAVKIDVSQLLDRQDFDLFLVLGRSN